MLVSILIPTYNRPKFLIQAIKSCLDHYDDNIEIIIGDDSDETDKEFINNLELPVNYQIFYHHHSPALKQNKNVNYLINKAVGDYSLILHDDDFLISHGLSKLIAIAKSLSSTNFIIFGKQALIDNNGRKLEDKQLNYDYYRRKEHQGIQLDSLFKVLRQQVPSNSFLFPSTLSKKINYKSYEEVGDACDFDFSLRMVIEGKCNLYFLDEYVSSYRLSSNSVSKREGYNSIFYKYKILKELEINKSEPLIFKKILHGDINVLCGYYIHSKNKSSLREIYFSKNYPLRKRFSIRGLYHLIKIL